MFQAMQNYLILLQDHSLNMVSAKSPRAGYQLLHRYV